MPQGFTAPMTHPHHLVYLDVGGRTFRVWRRTLLRYPESLLTKMLYEFPELTENGESIYIDRNPKYFEWILEIYRNGDYDCSIPETSEEILQRELDFYELPNLKELEICPRCDMKVGYRLRSIVEDIITEINRRGLHRFFPFDVYLYYKYTKDIRFDGQMVLLRCPSHVGRIINPPDIEHTPFYSALWEDHKAFNSWPLSNLMQCAEYPGYVTIEAIEENLLIKRFDEKEMKSVQQEAWKHGLRVERRLSKHTIGGRNVEIDYLYVSCT